MNQIIAKLKSSIRRALMTRAQRRYELVGPHELWKMKRQFQIDFLKRFGLKPEHFLVDIGCGVLRGGLPIIEYLEPEHYYGIEAREYVLNEGRKELREAHLENKKPNLIAAEHLADVSLGREFDVIWAFSVLIHLQDNILDGVLEFVSRHLKSDGVFYANVETMEKADGKWQEFPGVRRPIAFYRERLASHGLNFKDLGALKDFGHITGGDADVQPMLEIRKV